MTKTFTIKSPNQRISRLEYKARLAAVASKLEPNSIAIFVSNPEATRTGDTEYPYRQSSDILYLNGFPEPNAAVVIAKFDGQSPKLIMFVQPKDPAQEVWTGIRIGVEGACRSYGASIAYTIDQFKSELAKLIEKADHVYYKFGVNPELDLEFKLVWQPEQLPLFNPESIVHEMRMRKSEKELVLIQRAANISAEAHCRAMRSCRPGLYEFQMQAVLENMFTDSGASAPAYGSIVAGGNHACVLHYTSNRAKLEGGDLVLIDAACEFAGYASDITRTFPVNGKFTDAQREIYELVLKAQLAGIAMAKPGSSLKQVHEEAARVLQEGLVELGILSKEDDGLSEEERLYFEGLVKIGLMSGAQASEAAQKIVDQRSKKGTQTVGAADATTGQESATLRTFFMHGTSHWMGLDVHDVGPRDHKLEPGMVFTVEPGLYFDKNDERVPARYRGIGVRIEDDVVVTADGCTVLTAGVPKAVEEIESLMSEDG